MSKKLTDLQAGALNAWTPVQQAALYHQQMAAQYAKDEEAKLKEILEAEKKEKKAESGEAGDDDKPDEVSAKNIVNSLLRTWIPPLYDFQDIFGPPHIAVVVFVGLHVLFWSMTPWYLHFLLAWPLQYFIPVYMTFKSIWAADHRAAWQAWWIIVALIEYVELVLFRDGVLGMVWWPKIKLAFCVWMYSAAKTEEKRDKQGKKTKVPVFGSVVLVQRYLNR